LYYTITKSNGTSGLTFSADDFKGTLIQKRGGWYGAELTDNYGSPFGVIRLRREAGGILTNFKADKNSPDWGSDHLAIRIGEDMTRVATTNGFVSQRDKDAFCAKTFSPPNLSSSAQDALTREKSPARSDRARSASPTPRSVSPTPRSASPRRSPGKDDGSCCLPGKALCGSPRSTTKAGQPLTLYLPKELNGMQVLTRMAGVNRWQAHDTFLRSETDGIFYRWSKDLSDRHSLMTVRFGDTVEGSDEFDGWIKCKVLAVEERDRYLPLSVRGHVVLQQLSQTTWQLVNNSLQDATDGLGYRNSKRMTDVDVTCLGPRWGDVITGADLGDGWVKCEFDMDRISDAASDRILNTPFKETMWTPTKLVATPSTGCSSPVCMGALTPTRTPSPTSMRSTTPVRALVATPTAGGFSPPTPTGSLALSPQAALFNAIDRNHDGVISRVEFNTALTGQTQPAPAPQRPPVAMPPRALLPRSPIRRAGAASPPYRGAAATPPRYMVPTYPATSAQPGNLAAWAWPQSPTGAYAPPAGNYAANGYYTKSRVEYDDGRT
jgi:hypothetical protein